MSDAGTVAAATATTAATSAAVTLATDSAWASFDDETKGTFTNKGWDRLAPAAAAQAALAAYREAEKFVGAPKDQLLRLPKAGEPIPPEVWQRLGAPKEAKDYDFSGIKFSDGTDLDDAFKDSMTKAFHERGVPKDSAVEITKSFVKFMDDSEKFDTVQEQAKMATEAAELEKSWGANMKPNTFIANQAAEKLGLGKDILNTLAKTSGRVAVAQALLKIGQLMGEDKFVNHPNDGTRGVMTKEQASAELDALMNDAQWGTRFDQGDARARQQFHALTSLLAA